MWIANPPSNFECASPELATATFEGRKSGSDQRFFVHVGALGNSVVLSATVPENSDMRHDGDSLREAR